MLARYEIPLYDVMPHHLQSGDYLAWTATAFPTITYLTESRHTRRRNKVITERLFLAACN